MYKYENEKEKLFTDEGQRLFLAVRDRALKMSAASGGIMMENIIAGFCGSSWELLACVDRMVELDELIEIPNPYSSAGQHRIFVLNDTF